MIIKIVDIQRGLYHFHDEITRRVETISYINNSPIAEYIKQIDKYNDNVERLKKDNETLREENEGLRLELGKQRQIQNDIKTGVFERWDDF